MTEPFDFDSLVDKLAANATFKQSAPVRMSTLIRDPIVRAAFQRAERDYGQTFAIPDDPPRVLDGGAAEPVGELFGEVAA